MCEFNYLSGFFFSNDNVNDHLWKNLIKLVDLLSYNLKIYVFLQNTTYLNELLARDVKIKNELVKSLSKRNKLGTNNISDEN